MQRVEGRQAEAVGTFEQMQQLPVELRRGCMLRMPVSGKNEEISSDEPPASIRQRFIEERDEKGHVRRDAVNEEQRAAIVFAHDRGFRE
jgi:hypothetical protein